METQAVSVTIVNPLGGALDHYSDALAEALRATARSVAVRPLVEPSRGGGSRTGWLAAYLRELMALRRRARHRGEVVIVAWPVLGYLDVVLLRFLFGRRARAHVVVHDPKPLVRALGYSRPARFVARLVAGRSTVIAQSKAARVVLDDLGFGSVAQTLPLPLGLPESVAPRKDAVIRVLGQFKRDRDTQLLEELADELDGRYLLEIHGRGWPEVAGWRVVEGFVSEERFDELVSTSGAVLIPYRRFYQSDVAVRCLERATPFVGPRESSLAEYYDDDSPLLVATKGGRDQGRAEVWSRAIDRACAMDQAKLHELSLAVRDETTRAWRQWLQAA